MRVVVLGGGAAGFFAGLSAAEHHPGAEVIILERSTKVLSKVRISGGGRCNVTHACFRNRQLAANYPRGERFLRRSFELFSARDTVHWFEERGVELKAEMDGRMFPVSDDSGSIVDCLLNECTDRGVRIEQGTNITRIEAKEGVFVLGMANGSEILADRLIITIGGHPKKDGYHLLEALGHSIVQPVPSLFTFNMPEEPIRELMGVVVPARVRVEGSDLQSTGPVLITHWGMSGPAILKLSAWGARSLHTLGYEFAVRVNWLEGLDEATVRRDFHTDSALYARRRAENVDPYKLPKRFWTFLLNKAGIPKDLIWDSVGKKERNRLIDLLTNDRYTVSGKTTFKEEFVTAGGVALDEVRPLTMESRKVEGLYFAGEVLDIDGITGGFNFQAAWTTGYIAGQLLKHQ
ncbi:MAG: NAD(P)/FAD-dependent oxidoreductase [Flavobacteriales bacterium]|nr:NAD(P)/FAD-dependent oxidoreductase [Flavobacteriales bacterium]